MIKINACCHCLCIHVLFRHKSNLYQLSSSVNWEDSGNGTEVKGCILLTSLVKPNYLFILFYVDVYHFYLNINKTLNKNIKWLLY